MCLAVLVLQQGTAFAESHPLTLKQAVQLALRQNPQIILSRLDEQKLRAGVLVAKDPFVPKVYAGSGLAYTNGYPASIEGNAPSIIQVRSDMSLYNRPKSYELAEARENVRGAAIDVSAKGDEIVSRTADLFLDAEMFERNVKSLEEQAKALDRVNEVVQLRVNEGRELPLAGKRSALDLARARNRQGAAEEDLRYTAESLAVVLGFPAGDIVRPVEDDSSKPEIPTSESECIGLALRNNKDIRRMESQVRAKEFEVRSQHTQRLPEVDLVAQYALFAKYNYQNFFSRFQRNNGELGISIKIPVLVGSAPAGLAAEAEVDMAKLRTQMSDLRNRTALDTRKAFHDLKQAESSRDFAKLDLEVAREQVRVLLDQMDEGRATRQAVDESRTQEQEKWMAFYDGQRSVEKARINLLRFTGTLQAALH